MSQLDDMVDQATATTVEVDFSAALDFDPLEGDFPFKILEAVPGMSRPKPGVHNGQPKVTLKCEVVDGDKAGRKAQKDLPLIGEGSGITKKVLSVLGFDLDEVAANGLHLPSLAGLFFLGSCRKSKFNEDFTDIFRVKEYTGAAAGSSL